MSEFGDFNKNDFDFKTKNVNNVDVEKAKSLIKPVVTVVVVFLALLIIFNLFTFTVNEKEQVVIRQFTEIVKVIVSDEYYADIKDELASNPRYKNVVVKSGKGLFFKIPIIQTKESYPTTLLTYDTTPNELVTEDKKRLVLDNYAQWKIKDPVLYLSTVGTSASANSRIDEILYSSMRQKIGKEPAIKVISDKTYIMNMLEEIKTEANAQLNQFGIEVVDIRIKRTELPPENFENLYNRMRTERNKEATKYRSEGKEEAQKIKSEAEKEAVVIEAEAYKEAEKTKGEGDAAALKIYADAFSSDIDFYEFWRTLEAYKNTLSNDTTIVLDPNSSFLNILNRGN